MKFSKITIMAAAFVASASAQDTKTVFQWAFWCCLDSNERCSDACEYINNCDNQAAAAMLSNGMTGNCQTLTLEALNAAAVDTVDGPFGPVSIAGVPALCRDNTDFECCDGGDGYVCESGDGSGVFGDPHFKTWGGMHYDYQGECDLKFISAPKYAKGLGLDIHIRTSIRFDYSYISSAAIKVGDNILEVGAWGEYILNGVDGAKAPGTMMLGDNLHVTYETKSKLTHIFTIDASELTGDSVAKIRVQTFKDWVSIHMEHPKKDDFVDSIGMLGSFPEGTRFARDGVTIVEDDNEFGQEWQVLPEEAVLFQGARTPQHPQRCVLPKAMDTQRRLSMGKISEEEARVACSHLEMHQEFCVRDVLATQDLEFANAGAF